MSSDLTIVLNEINNVRDEIHADREKFWEAIEKDREKHHALDKVVAKLKLKSDITEKSFDKHVGNLDKHYKPHFKESYGKKMIRKKDEIGTSVAIGMTAFGFLIAALNYFGWI